MSRPESGGDLVEQARALLPGLTLKMRGHIDYAKRYGYLPAPQTVGDWIAHDRLGDLGLARTRILTALGIAAAELLAAEAEQEVRRGK